MKFFVGFVPLDLSLRIMDVFLLEGTKSLLKFAMSILLYFEEDLLKIFDFSEFVLKLNGKLKCETDKIISIARLIEIPDEKVAKIFMRSSHKIVVEMRSNTKSNFIKKYKKISLCKKKNFFLF
jgi:hypothetical protein